VKGLPVVGDENDTEERKEDEERRQDAEEDGWDYV